MKLIIVLHILLFSFFSVTHAVERVPYPIKAPEPNTEEWFDFCKNYKSLLSSVPWNMAAFDKTREDIPDGFQPDSWVSDYNGILIPIPRMDYVEYSFSLSERTESLTVKLTDEDGSILKYTVWDYTNYDDVLGFDFEGDWIESNGGYAGISAELFGAPSDLPGIIKESFSWTPEDIKCQPDTVYDDLKPIVLMTYKTRQIVSYYPNENTEVYEVDIADRKGYAVRYVNEAKDLIFWYSVLADKDKRYDWSFVSSSENMNKYENLAFMLMVDGGGYPPPQWLFRLNEKVQEAKENMVYGEHKGFIDQL